METLKRTELSFRVKFCDSKRDNLTNYFAPRCPIMATIDPHQRCPNMAPPLLAHSK